MMQYNDNVVAPRDVFQIEQFFMNEFIQYCLLIRFISPRPTHAARTLHILFERLSLDDLIANDLIPTFRTGYPQITAAMPPP